MNGYYPGANAWHAATFWIDKELHRWGVCLLIVLVIHVGAIASFEAWKIRADHPELSSGVMMIDLGPLPAPGGHAVANKPGAKPQHAAASSLHLVSKPHTATRPPMRVEVRKHHHFPRLVKLRAKVEHLLKPKPRIAEQVPTSSAVPPKPDSSALADAARAVPAMGADNSESEVNAGGSTASSGGCCGGTSRGGAAGFGQGGSMTWEGLLLAHLEAYKRYPLSAQERGEQGVAYLRFALNRQGKVLSFSLEKSSGFSDLDQETLDLIQRSQPLPPPPASVAGNVIQLVVPVQFELQQGG